MRIVLCLLFTVSSVALAQPTVLVPAEEARVRDGYRLLGRVWVRPAGRFEFSQIVTANVTQSRLQISIEPDAVWKPKLINARRIIAEAEADLSLWWMMLTQTTQLVPPSERGTSIVMLPAKEPSPADASPLRLSGVTIAPGGMIVRGAGTVDARFVRVEYRASAEGLAPRLTIAGEDGRGFDYVGNDLVDLLQKDAAVVRAYLSPLLKQLSGRDLLAPRAADVYRAFLEIEPTPAERRQFRDILQGFDSENAAVRAEAYRQLRAAGPAMVLVAVRSDLAQLAPEPATQVLLLLEENSLGETSIDKLRADYQALRALDLFPDRRVRDLSRELLAEFVD